MSSFNILLIKKWPGGDVEQVIPVGSLGVSCPTFAGAVLRECTRLSRQCGDWVRLPGEGSAADQPVDSLFPACCWPSSLCFLNCFLGVMGVGPLSGLISAAEAGGAGFVVCFVLYLNSTD